MELTLRQRAAANDMRYLAKAWNFGYQGPHENPKGSTCWWRISKTITVFPFIFDEDRVKMLDDRWHSLSRHHHFAAEILRLHYRDEREFKGEYIAACLDAFNQT